MPGSESDFRANHNSSSRPDFDTFIKKKRQQYNVRKQQGRFPRNRGFSRGFSSRRPNNRRPFSKGTRFPFRARSRSPIRNKLYSRRSRSPSQSKYNSRKSRSHLSDKGNFLTNLEDGSKYSTSRIDSDSSFEFEGRKSSKSRNNLQVERSCSPRESLRITIDNDRCESVNSPILQTDYTMSDQQWGGKHSWRSEDSSRRSRSGSNYSNSPDNRSRNNQKEEPTQSIFTRKHLSDRDMHNFDDDVHASAVASKATPKPFSQTNSTPSTSIFTQKHLSDRDMHNFDDDVHSSAVASKVTPTPLFISDLSSSASSSSFNRNESKRQNDDDLSSGFRKRYTGNNEYTNNEAFTATSSSSHTSQIANRIFAITESSNYNTEPFTAPRQETSLFHRVEVKPSRVKGTLKIGINPPKKVKSENAPAAIPFLDLESDEVEEYLYGGDNSNDSQSKSPAPETSTNVMPETTISQVSAQDPRLRKNSVALASRSDAHQSEILPTQIIGVPLYSTYDTSGASSLYYPNTVQPSTSQLPLPAFGGVVKSRHTNSFNANNLKQIPISTPSEILASQNNEKTNDGDGISTSSSGQTDNKSWTSDAKIVNKNDRENADFLIKSHSDKLSKYKTKLQDLKREELELIKQTQRRKDGFIDPKYSENRKHQSSLNKSIQECDSKIESLKKRIHEYEKEKSSERALNPNQNVKNSSTDKIYTSRSNLTPRNESPIEKPKSSQVAFQHVDYRNHFCTHCCEVIPSVEDFLNHLHSAHLDVVNNMRDSDRPWAIKSKDNKIQKADKVLPAPIKGVEFMLPTTGFYCKLCKELFGDNASAKIHLESYSHNKMNAKYCQENLNYEKKINLQRNAKINADRNRRLSNENQADIPNQSKNNNEMKPAAALRSCPAKSVNKKVMVTSNTPENLPPPDEGSHTITKPGAKIPIKLKDKGVANNVMLAMAATKADELLAVKNTESEASTTSPNKYSFKPVQFKKPMLRGAPLPLEEFITIGSSAPLPEELASPPPLKLQPNIKPNLPVTIKTEPKDTGYDKYMHSVVGTQNKNEVDMSPPDDKTGIDQTEGSYSKREPKLPSHSDESDSMNLDTENIKSEHEEDNHLNLKIISVQSLNSENGAQNFLGTAQSPNHQEKENSKQINENDDWDSDRETLPDEDRMDLLDEDLCYHENDQAISLATNDGRIKIENFTLDDSENLWH